MEVDYDLEYDDLALDLDDPHLIDLLDNPHKQNSQIINQSTSTRHRSPLPHLALAIQPTSPFPPPPTPLSPEPNPAPSQPPPPVSPSAQLPNLYEQFRRRRGFGSLSVSDLVAPSWCEVQHSYRLLSHAHLPASQRPATITTPAGNTLAVSLSSMLVRDRILDSGTATHARIEKAVMGDVVAIEVAVAGREEVWALKVVNLVVLLEMLLVEGKVREVPVWGFVGDKLVLGVVDQVERRERVVGDDEASVSEPKRRPPSPPARLTPPIQDDDDPADTALTAEEEAALQEILLEQNDKWRTTPLSPPPPPRSIRTGFLLSDTKTRHSRSLPPPADSRSAKLQLMLYHRLLAGILGPTSQSPTSQDAPSRPAGTPTSLASPGRSRHPHSPTAQLIAHLGLAADVRLSDAFLESVNPLLTPTSHALLAHAVTLADFFAGLGRMSELVGGDEALHARLEVNYVLRTAAGGWEKKNRGPQRGRRATELTKGGPCAAGAQAGTGGVDGAGGAASGLPPSQAEPSSPGPVLPARVSPDTASPTVTSNHSLRRSKRLKPTPVPVPAAFSSCSPLPSPLHRPASDIPVPVELVKPLFIRQCTPDPHETAPMVPKPPSEEDPDFIGTEAFAVDGALLDAWLASAMSLWLGERAPEGVSLEQTGRCRGCEFSEDCEWLTAKAEEVRAEAEAKRRKREEGMG